VRHGTKVTWKFQDGTDHNVTVKRGPAKFHSKDIARGTYSHKLTKRGTYKLICSIHTDMHQTIVVR
jgi:plastocyanin